MIRQLTPQDRQFYIECSKAFYSSSAVVHDVDAKNFETTFNMLINNDPSVAGYILECDGERAGYFIASFAYSNEVGGLVMWCEELFVLPQYRQKGIASSMIEYVKANYAHKVKRFRLEVTKSNARAARLYSQLGFNELQYLQMHIDN